MSTRLWIVATTLLVGGLLWVVDGASASANPLLGLIIDGKCDATTHTVTILTADIHSPHSITLIGQIFVNNKFSDVGSPKQVTIPTNATSTQTDISIPPGNGSGYRVRVVDSDLDNASGAVSNEVHCESPPTATPTATPTPTATRPKTIQVMSPMKVCFLPVDRALGTTGVTAACVARSWISLRRLPELGPPRVGLHSLRVVFSVGVAVQRVMKFRHSPAEQLTAFVEAISY